MLFSKNPKPKQQRKTPNTQKKPQQKTFPQETKPNQNTKDETHQNTNTPTLYNIKFLHFPSNLNNYYFKHPPDRFILQTFSIV